MILFYQDFGNHRGLNRVVPSKRGNNMRTPLFKNREGDVHTKDEWLWIIGNAPIKDGTPEEVFRRCLIKKLIVRFR